MIRFNIIIANLIITFVSFFIPKSDDIIIVGGWFGDRFADNSKHLYLYAHKHKKELNLKKVVWITNNYEIKKELENENYKVYYKWSLYSIWYHFRAKHHFIDQSINDINPFFSVRSNRINLWHGFPLKKVGYLRETDRNKQNIENSKFLKRLHNLSTKGFWGDNYLLATSKFSANLLGKAFKVPKEKIIISGYPRNYGAFNESIDFKLSSEREGIKKIKEAKRKKNYIFTYLPTFRDNMNTKIFGTSNPKELINFLDFLNSKNIVVVGKFHFANNDVNMNSVCNHNSFINLSSDLDVYSFIEYSDVLITDYSSIYFDFLLWNKPIIFFPYDLDYYKKNDRGLIFNYNEFTPGPKTKDILEFKKLISKTPEDFIKWYNNEYFNKANQLKKKVFKNPNKRGINHLFRQIKNLN